MTTDEQRLAEVKRRADFIKEYLPKLMEKALICSETDELQLDEIIYNSFLCGMAYGRMKRRGH